MGEKTLNFGDIVVNKKKFMLLSNTFGQILNEKLKQYQRNYYASKKKNKILIFVKGFKYFIGYKEDDIIRPLCIILPQMSGYIKHAISLSRHEQVC